MTSLALVFLLFVGGTLKPSDASKMSVERVFGPEVKTGPYKHPASIAELTNGDLYLVYYGGKGEYATDTGVFGSRMMKDGRHWSRPKALARDPFRSLGNGVIWQAPDGTVWLFYVVRWGETWSTSRVQGKISRDGAQTWSDSFVVSDKEGMMVRGRPIVLDTGEYLLPVYHETGNNTEMTGADSTSRFLRFSPRTKKWTESGKISSAKGNIQPAIAQLSHSHLIAYCRRGGGYEPTKEGWMVSSESTDGGKTWAEGKDCSVPNPNSAVDLLKLRNGHLLLIYNDSMNDRTPLTIALSTDGGKTWPHKRNLATGPYDYAYPYAIQSKNGKVHVVYTSHERTVVNHAVFGERWVTKGR